MGGRLVLHARPRRTRRRCAGWCSSGATAGIDDPAARRARVERDEDLARRIERDGVEAFVSRVAGPAALRRASRPMQFVDERLHQHRRRPGRQPAARPGTGAQDPLWDRLATIETPVLVMAGEQDTKFATEAERLAVAIGANAELALVPGAGHSPHLEQPDAWLDAVDGWLAARAGVR